MPRSPPPPGPFSPQMRLLPCLLPDCWVRGRRTGFPRRRDTWRLQSQPHEVLEPLTNTPRRRLASSPQGSPAASASGRWPAGKRWTGPLGSSPPSHPAARLLGRALHCLPALSSPSRTHQSKAPESPQEGIYRLDLGGISIVRAAPGAPSFPT